VAAHLKIPVKGYQFMLKVLERLRDVPNIYLLSVGKSDPNPPEGIPHLHLGHVTDDTVMADAYRAADLFANPTRAEAFGLTTVEAMACETPVVGFAVGGLLDTIRDGETGFLIPPSDDPGEFAAKCRLLLTDSELRARLSARCSEVVRADFLPDLQSRRYVDVYHRLLAAQSPGSLGTGRRLN
jgi:glycosyltransferase involved in cell wall biosynthesis